MNLQKNQRRAGWVQLGYMALSFALSYIAGRLLAKKSGLKIDDDKPTTLTTRGSYANFLIGLRRVGPVFTWAGDREIKKEKAGGGKGGGGSQKTEIFYEAGWHILCSNGPVRALHQIIQSGKIIFQGPITPDSHPSGSTINLGKEGSFTIFWGEENQPINSFLGNANRVGIASRWPFFCYVVWNKKRLSGSPQWPVLDYVIDRRCEISETILTQTPSYYEPTRTLTGPTEFIFGHVNGGEGTGHFIVAGDITNNFKPLDHIQLLGNSMPDGDYIIYDSETFVIQVGTNPLNGAPIYATRSRIYLYGGVSGANDSGTMQTYIEQPDDGLNPAHIVAEVLFAEWPQGLGIDPNNSEEPWDIDSLEAFGVDSDDQDMRASYVGRNGERASACLAAFLQDYGVMLPIDTHTGRLKFVLVREPVLPLPNIALGAQVVALPEIETMHGERAVDKLVFKFADREHSFGDMTIAIDDDGQASFEENARSRVVECPTVVNFNSAAVISDRRSQEELAGATVVTYNAARGARTLIPGMAITMEGIADHLRVVGVEFDPLSSAVKLRCMVDYYGTQVTNFVNNPGGGETEFEPVEPDEQFSIVEVPEYLLGGDPMTIVIPRVRAHDQIIGADLWISRDNSTYNLVGTELNVQTGGVLTQQLDATDPKYEATSVTFDALGPDIATVLDLTGDDTNWMLGRQVMVIVSDVVEICFVKKITSLGGASYRIDGLVRARYDTMRATHPIGSKVYIFEFTAIEFIQDLLLVPNEDLFAKTQPNASSGQLPLSSVAPDATVLRGKGTTPMDPIALHVTAPFAAVHAYSAGNDIGVKWGYRSTQLPKTGAGLQSSGVVCGTSLPQGTFTLEFLTTGNVLKRTASQVANFYTYANADLVADFAGEPAAFKVRVTLTNGGFASDPIEITVTKV